MSLYIASGLPIVIWKEAAQARFVEENGIGICVGSLEEIGGTLSRMSENEYCGLIENVNKINNEVTTGKYAENALYLSIKML